MFVVGLTGGIGTGKSEVARLLGELGAAIINADHVGHEEYQAHSDAWREVVEAFGAGILKADGEIDRTALGAIVFHDPQSMATLNSIMHPRMAKATEKRIQQLARAGVGVAVVEAALLYEAGWDSLVDEVWVTKTSEDKAIARVKARSNLIEEQIRGRMASQMSMEEKAKRGDVVVTNEDGLPELKSQVQRLWDQRVKERIS